MDPALRELIEDGAEQDEVSVIIRLKDEASIPPDVRVVSRFGKIVTARLLRGDIHRIYERDEITSMKASRKVGSLEPYDDELAELTTGLEATYPMSKADAESVAEDGTGVIIGICDWGLDFTHKNFRNGDGTTRFLALWDQSAEATETPMPYGYGRVYTREEINSALTTPDPTATLGYHPSIGDPLNNGAHGCHVLDIIAGNRRESGSQVGLASASEIVGVHLATERLRLLENFGDSVRLLEGLDFLRRQAGERPLVMHLSAGQTGGTHDATSPFAQAVDALVLERPGIVLVQSVGNYADSRMHTHARLGPNQEHVLHWLISPGDRTPNELEIWYSGQDEFDLALVAPNGARFTAVLGEHVKLIQGDSHWGTLYHRRSEPNSGMNHIDIFLKAAAPSGRYRVVLRGRDIVDGRFHAWIERDKVGRYQSRFPRRQATSQYTTNTICNSYRGIAVGAYDATVENRPPARFSSRGPTADGRQKPELVAPGYRILAARSLPQNGWHSERRLTIKSGTSMAAPWVSGTVALMMQAAGRPLTIAEVRRVLIGTADPVPGRAGRSTTRLGYGYLNTVAAVEAARQLGRHGSAEQVAASGHEELVDSSAGWAPRWIVDPQPFEHDAKDSIVRATDGDEISFEDQGGGADLGPANEDYDESLRDDLSYREQLEDDAYRVTDTLVTIGEDTSYGEADLAEWATVGSDEVEFEDEADGVVLVGSAVHPVDDTDLGSQDKDYEVSLRDYVSRQEEEEDEAYRLTELYNVLGEWAESSQMDG